MRVIHIYDEHARVFPGHGSVPGVIFNLAKHTAKKGHETTVLERRWKGLDYEEEISGINFIRFDPKIGSNIVKDREIPHNAIKGPFSLTHFILDRIDFANKINGYLKKEDFDIVHAHVPFATNILINLRRDLRENILYTAHIGEEKTRFALDSSSPLLFKIFSPDLYLMKRIKKSVVLNEPLKSKLVEKGVEEDSIDVIPNGVNLKDFDLSIKEVDVTREKYGLEDYTIVMFSGSVTPRKGVEHLIKAGELLKDRNIILLIVGNTNLNKEYVNKIKEYAEKRKINAKFTGYIHYEDLKALYSACDVFVLPSFEEGFGMVLTEALASGKPLIGSNVGGIPMQVKDGWNGFLVEPGDERQLAERIGYLVENEGERVSMGERSRKLAKDEFDWSRIAEKYLQAYGDIR